MKIFIVFLLFAQSIFAQDMPDYEKESRWAEQVEDSLMDGDIVWLNANNHKFMAIWMPSEQKSKKSVVIVHGIGIHPNWQQVIQPLRIGLSEKGFNTLSIQMPVLANGVEGKQYQGLFINADKRIMAAVNYLKEQQLDVDILLAHSLGAVMSAHYLANNPGIFKKFVAIGMSNSAVKYLSKINIPTLDLYGDEDIPPVLNSVNSRFNEFKNNKNYTQKQVNADHFFNGKDDLLLNEVGMWLR